MIIHTIITFRINFLDFSLCMLSYVLMPDDIYSVEDNAAGKGLMSYIVEGVTTTVCFSQVLNIICATVAYLKT